MDILYLLVPMSVLVMFGVLGVFAWAVSRGQFDALEVEGERVLLDPDQGVAASAAKESGT